MDIFTVEHFKKLFSDECYPKNVKDEFEYAVHEIFAGFDEDTLKHIKGKTLHDAI